MARAVKPKPTSSSPQPLKSRNFNLLGLDPGTNSFAYSVVNVRLTRAGKLTLKVLQHGMINCTMRDLKFPGLLRSQLLQYKECVLTLTAKYDVRAVIAERYMLRRGQGGTAIEAINMMLGVLIDLGYPTKIIPASQWKNAMRRQLVDLDGLYAEGKPLGITPHQIDATHIAVFGAQTLTTCSANLDNVLPQLAVLDAVALGTSTKKDAETVMGVRKVKRRRKTLKVS